MIEHSPRHRIVVVDQSDEFLTHATNVFSGHAVYPVRSVGDARSLLRGDHVDGVVVGPTYATEHGINEAGSLLEAAQPPVMVLVADSLDAATLHAALRAGFRDAIESPLSLAKVEDALAQIEHVQEQLELQPSRAHGGKIVTIMSPKGGSGKTVTATNVALVIALEDESRHVVMLDADLQFGDVSIAMRLNPQTSLVDAATNLDKLDRAFLESLLVDHESGVRVLAAPLEPALADEVSTAAVVKVLELLRQMADFVVVDTAPFLDEPVLTVLEMSDEVLLLVDMDMPSVKNAKLALDTLRLIDFPMERIKLVLNRVNSKARLDVDELERSLDMPVMAAIPSDKLVPRSVNEGVPVVALHPRSRVARGFHNVTRIVTGGRHSDQAPRRRRS